jgi:hypothetical protein
MPITTGSERFNNFPLQFMLFIKSFSIIFEPAYSPSHSFCGAKPAGRLISH